MLANQFADFGRGEGVGVVVLKALDDALRDGDTIRSVVLASVAQEDGWTPGIMLPNSEAQRNMIRTAYTLANVDPADTGYVEAHGTGTQVGDPLEARAIMETIGDEMYFEVEVLGRVQVETGSSVTIDPMRLFFWLSQSNPLSPATSPITYTRVTQTSIHRHYFFSTVLLQN